ncbi:hypothetical protein BpHYR1_043002 [Brachionus plicatilis]|uniref:Uncharacterized protein n=1 Tax=Brachionus plicatilis TaxID=10195 RepID=A0A3M7SM14_BRAPC|nr:hypothetical protein BpHYR1_043002 [Brachionus plicatilis]
MTEIFLLTWPDRFGPGRAGRGLRAHSRSCTRPETCLFAPGSSSHNSLLSCRLNLGVKRTMAQNYAFFILCIKISWWISWCNYKI